MGVLSTMMRGTMTSALAGAALLLVLAWVCWNAAESPESNVVTRLIAQYYNRSVVGPVVALKTLAAVFAAVAIIGLVLLVVIGPRS